MRELSNVAGEASVAQVFLNLGGKSVILAVGHKRGVKSAGGILDAIDEREMAHRVLSCLLIHLQKRELVQGLLGVYYRGEVRLARGTLREVYIEVGVSAIETAVLIVYADIFALDDQLVGIKLLGENGELANVFGKTVLVNEDIFINALSALQYSFVGEESAVQNHEVAQVEFQVFLTCTIVLSVEREGNCHHITNFALTQKQAISSELLGLAILGE